MAAPMFTVIHTFEIPALGKQRQEDGQGFEASLDDQSDTSNIKITVIISKFYFNL